MRPGSGVTSSHPTKSDNPAGSDNRKSFTRATKLVIQIPCFNEAGTLPITLAALPRDVDGFDRVEWLVIDDGSTDETVEVARKSGVDHIVRLRHNQGLAVAFMAGIQECLKLGADVIVNTDADNQYDASCIPDLVAPIVIGKADIVVGERPISEIAHFSPIKKLLQYVGSWAVRFASGTDIPDAPSGFRAIHREAAMRLNVFGTYTYTLETIIQAGRKNMRITSVPVKVNEDLRPSRLVKSIPNYVRRSIITILRIFFVYRPFAAFIWIGIAFMIPAIALGLRYLWFIAIGEAGGHVQSLILAAIVSMAGLLSFSLAIVADLLAVNRSLLEDVRLRLMKLELARRNDRAE